jgi:hypothetical protein
LNKKRLGIGDKKSNQNSKRETSRMIIMPESDGKAAVTIVSDGIIVTSHMQFEEALEKLFALKTTYIDNLDRF